MIGEEYQNNRSNYRLKSFIFFLGFISVVAGLKYCQSPRYKSLNNKPRTEQVIEKVTTDKDLVDIMAEYNIHHDRIGPLSYDSSHRIFLFGYTNMSDKTMLINGFPNLDAKRFTVLHEVNHVKDYNLDGVNNYTEDQIDSLALNDFRRIYLRDPIFTLD